MPVNVTPEYLKAENAYQKAKTIEEKIFYLEEMIRQCPKHHGSETALAQLKSRLAKLRKEAVSRKKVGGRKGVSKEGEAQVCVIGKTMSGKSTLLISLTDAKPVIADHPYTTTKPVVGMIDYSGVKVQLIEIPSTFDSEYMSICRTADLILITVRNSREKKEMLDFIENKYIKTKYVVVDSSMKRDDVKKAIWNALGFILVYTKDKGKVSPMALKKRAVLRDFAFKIHKDFVNHFRFAQLWRRVGGKTRKIQVGLEYKLEDGDIVELHMR
ncbi:MAG: TGS domain-containing protein [Candidatus Aenigmatarchaeota archaeon]